MINAGRILIIPKGEWDSLTSYDMLDLVTYDGIAYIAKQAGVGINPKTDPNKDSYWQTFGTAVVPDGTTIIYDASNDIAVNIDGTTLQYDSSTQFIKVAIDGVTLKYDSINGYIYANVSSSLAGLTDVQLTNIQNGQIIAYNSSSQKFVNIDLPTGGGSKIKVTTTESTLYGKTVTLSDGTTTLTGTFSNAGEYTFEGVSFTGNLTISSSDGVDTATRTLNVPYYGYYTINMTFFAATINVTYPASAGATCTASDGVTTLVASGSPEAFIVPNAATWIVTVTLDGVQKMSSVNITTDGEVKSVAVQFGTINLTFDDDFRSQTITCTKGQTVITKTAPASGNTMNFYPPETGQWTIASTVSGQSYSKDVTVSSLTTPVQAVLETMPNGATYVPTDDISVWLACAQITDKNYTTLAQVLADSETYNRLLSDSNACDYMKRSTTWAGGVSVPTMTSNTTPSGTCSASSYYGSGYEAYKAFDGNDSTKWAASSGANESITYEFPSAVRIDKVYIKADVYSNTIRLKNFEIRSSNDSNFATYNTEYQGTIPSDTSGVLSVDISNPHSAKYWRLYCVDMYTGSADTISIDTLQFLSDAITDRANAMTTLGKYDYACYVLRSNNTWNTAINNSAYSSAIPASPTGQTDIVVAPPQSQVYYMQNGSPVTLCTTDNDGIGTVDWSSLPKGNITLYNTVAKDPDNLSNDYSKTVAITENTTEIYLMPDNVLEWFGWESSNLESVSTANGWSSSVTLSNPTYNVNDVTIAPSDPGRQGIGSKYPIMATSMKVIAKLTSGDQITMQAMSLKTTDDGSAPSANITSGSNTLYQINNLTGSHYALVHGTNGRQGKVSAIWHE